ncbi:MAG: FHA domain-containing protein, partial [Deltaproteobacteria bacterium]
MEAKENNTAGSGIRLDVLGKDGAILHSGEFIKDKIVLGRILSADLRIDDPRVSRIHALIEQKGDGIVLTDLASSHGTFVNGKKVVESKVQYGDTIRVGFIELKLEKGSGKASAPSVVSFEGTEVKDTDATLVNIERPKTESERRGTDRRKKDAFPEERRLEERRGGDRRIDQRKEDRRKDEEATQPGIPVERRAKSDRREPLVEDRRIDERRKGDRRVFD